MTIYCMHDAPNGIQNKKCFLNDDGEKLKKNELKYVGTPWTFLNPILENEMFKNGFLAKDGYIHNPDYDKLAEIIKKNIEELKSHPNLKSILHTNNEKFIINSKNKLSQGYGFLAMKTGDYLVIRGKKGIINQAYLFKVIDQTKIRYMSVHNQARVTTKMKVVCELPNKVYEKIYPRRGSFWEMKNEDELKEIKKYIK